MEQVPTWWQKGVIYQIYPRSFYDSNGDGIGDLAGITHKLDYLHWLGADAIWLSPIYPSPMADFGYDISDYTNIHPIFGTLQDLDTLISEAHQRQLKVILDFVPNHSSDEHPWFKESRSSRTNPKRDWYIWRDPGPDGGPPNNWLSLFGGPAWQFDKQTGQYYMHQFDVKQPDLNWRNPLVHAAMLDVLRFWLDRGVDGFRVDVLWMLLKDEQFRDNPMNPNWKPGDPPYTRQENLYTEDLPGMHEIVRDMRALLNSYGERILIGEIYLPVERLVTYYGKQLDEAHLPFNFQFVTAPEWGASLMQKIVDNYEALLPSGAWPNWVLGNHDRPRIATRAGRAQAQVAQVLLLTLRGTPTCYYGDELGMEDVVIPTELLHDPQGKDNPLYSRDPVRTPMQWDTEPNAGFCNPEVTPWLPVAPDFESYNIATQRQDAHSPLRQVQHLLHLRRTYPALNVGSYRSLEQNNTSCFVYLRQHEEQRVLIALNFSEQEQEIRLSREYSQGKVLSSTIGEREEVFELPVLHLYPNEGIVLEIE